VQAQTPTAITADGYVLPNGLEVILAPDHAVQVVGVSVWYRAGSQDDPPGKAGLARLFERLMFMGSSNVPDGAHSAVIEDAGGRVSALVDEERSRFGMTLPSNRLGLGLWLEADRMRSLAINDTTVADSRNALLEELGGRLEREPYAGALAGAIAQVYDSATCPGFARSALLQARTVPAITTSDVQAFYNQYYAPSNARLVITGDFDPATVRTQVAGLFGGFTRQPAPVHAACDGAPIQSPRRSAVSDRLADRLAVGQFFRVPGRDHADASALDLLGIILSQGPGGRLRDIVVRSTRTADATQGGRLGDRDGPGVFGLFAVAAAGVSGDSLASVLRAQIEWATSPALGDADLARARDIYRATTISDRERAAGLADALQRPGAAAGAGAEIGAGDARLMAVTLADVRRVAATWLAPAHALTLVVTPEPTP
jgi:predicted Zn-dependent peptidase